MIQRWNKFGLFLGLTCALFMSFVGSCTVKYSPRIHSWFAFLMYFAGVMHMFVFWFRINWFLDYQFDDHTSNYNASAQDNDSALLLTMSPVLRYRIHTTCLFFCVPFNILMFIVFAVVAVSCGTDTCAVFILDTVVALEYVGKE